MWTSAGLRYWQCLCGDLVLSLSCSALMWCARRCAAAWRLVLLDGDISFSSFQDLDYKVAVMLSCLKHSHFLSLITHQYDAKRVDFDVCFKYHCHIWFICMSNGVKGTQSNIILNSLLLGSSVFKKITSIHEYMLSYSGHSDGFGHFFGQAVFVEGRKSWPGIKTETHHDSPFVTQSIEDFCISI